MLKLPFSPELEETGFMLSWIFNSCKKIVHLFAPRYPIHRTSDQQIRNKTQGGGDKERLSG
jgi:hypothetical protein